MRLLLSLLVVSLAGLSFAQDTNFPAGPQYLVTSGSPMFLQSIATPSLSLSAPMPDPYIDQTQLAAAVISDPYPRVPDAFWSGVFWGQDKPVSPRVTTPSVTPEETAIYTYATANQPLPAEYVPTAVPAESSVIEITSARMPANLPASIFDPGVTGTADAVSLLNRGYGMSLGDLARYWKSHKRPSAHVFTNEDLHRK
ncbi:MAG: hypothetical protein WA485_03635 [Candidatus Sulfotelmatobacter sp.]